VLGLRRRLRAGIESGSGAVRVRPSTGSFTKKSSIARAPASRTGVPNKYYRGAQQASSCDCRRGWPAIRTNKPKFTPARPYENLPGSPTSDTGVPNKYYRGAQQILPGRPTNITGVPNKYYRGAQQILPGRPTNITGVPNKYYRGAQQILPGCPTSRLCGICCKTAHFVFALRVPLLLFLL
jgi:hypothetical protein